MHERSILSFLLEAAAFADIADMTATGDVDDAGISSDLFLEHHDFTRQVADSGIYSLSNICIFETEEFKAAALPREYGNPVGKTLKAQKGEYEYDFYIPIPNTAIRHFVRTSIHNPQDRLEVVITPSHIEVKQDLEGKRTHLWNSQAALRVGVGAVNEFSRLSSSAPRTSLPASI